MILPENLKAFTMNIKTEEGKGFFTLNTPEYWSFENYLNDTHSGHNENTLKQVNVVYRHYLGDIQRLQQLSILSEMKKVHTNLSKGVKLLNC